MVDGTIVECNTAYGGARATTDSHRKVAADHGFSAIADVDIMDADGEIALPVKGGKRLKENYVGKNLENYDFVVVLTHFKGTPNGRLRRRTQEHIDRHSLVGREIMDSFGRKDQESPLGQHLAGSIHRKHGRSGQIGNRL